MGVSEGQLSNVERPLRQIRSRSGQELELWQRERYCRRLVELDGGDYDVCGAVEIAHRMMVPGGQRYAWSVVYRGCGHFSQADAV